MDKTRNGNDASRREKIGGIDVTLIAVTDALMYPILR
jgi:hypothetical protein